MKNSQLAILSCACVLAAGAAVALASAGSAANEKAEHSALALYGVATVTHHDAEGQVLSTQSMHNALLDAGEDYILSQVFMDGQSSADATQIGAICLSADDTAIAETLDAATFNTNHAADADTLVQGSTGSTIAASDTRECLTDTAVASSGQIATVGPLTFTANNTASTSNWKPDVTIKMIGICQGFSTPNAASCTAPLFAAVDINDVTLNVDETLTVTYTFDMTSPSS